MDTIATPCLCKHVIQSLSRVRLFETSWAGAHKAPLSPAISWSLLKLTSTEAVTPSNQLLSATLFPLCLQVCAPLRLSHMHLISFLACWSPFWPTRDRVPWRRGRSGPGCCFLTSTESRVRTSVSFWRTQGPTGLQWGGNREPGVSWAQIWWGLVAPPLPCHWQGLVSTGGVKEEVLYIFYTEEVQVGYKHTKFELIHGWDLFIINILIDFMQITTLKWECSKTVCPLKCKFNHCSCIFIYARQSPFLY